MTNATEEIKSKLDIVDVLKNYLELKPAGKNFKAICPFHREKTPSFMVSPERQSWHCFGCNIGGDIFTFLMKYENIEFFEALKILAEKAGIELKKINPAGEKQFGVLYDINEEAKFFFHHHLGESELFKNYLKNRGLKEETITEFELGASPSGWDELLVHLVNKNFDPQDILRAGLIVKSEGRGTYFDRFRHRLMFPILNATGKVVGFSGRILPEFEAEEKMGKYVNSPETPIFLKHKLLYGFDKSKAFIRESKQAVLVEGQMDLLMSWQEGVKNVVASSGTAFTEDHIKSLSRLVDEIVINFDSDEAGFAAGERAIDLIHKTDIAVKVLSLEGVKDPAELAVKFPGKLKNLIAEAIPAMEFFFRRYLSLAKESVKELKKSVRLALSKIKIMPSAVERNFWLKELSKKTGVPENTLLEEMSSLSSSTLSIEKNNFLSDSPAPLMEESFTRKELLSQKILSQTVLKGIAALEGFEEMIAEKFKDVLLYFKKDLPADKQSLPAQASELSTTNPELDHLLELVYLKSGLDEEENLDELKKQLRIEHLKGLKERLFNEIKLAAADGKIDKESLLSEFYRVSRELDEVVNGI